MVVATQGCSTDAPGRGSDAAARRADASHATRAAIRATTGTTAAPAQSTETTTTVTTAVPVAATTAAPATTTTTTARPVVPAPSVEQLGAEAVRLVHFDLTRLPGWQIAFLPARPGFQGRTFPDLRRIEVYVSSGDSARMVSYDLAHEIGHAVDLTYSTRASRLAFRSIRGIPAATLWFGCGDCPDFATPSGDFAESFGFIVTDPAFDWRSKMGPRPTAAQRAAIVALYHL